MNPTVKCLTEINRVQSDIKSLEDDRADWQAKAIATNDWRIRKVYQTEMRRIEARLMKKGEKLTDLESMGISTAEQSAVKKEADHHFLTIARDKSLGATDYTKVGYSKVTGTFLKVRMTQYSSFMRNVKGCASMAEKKVLLSVETLTEEQVNTLLAAGCKNEVNFIGHSESVVPIRVDAETLKKSRLFDRGVSA